MVKQKLEIKPSFNGYEFEVKDITGFGDGGYSETTLNVNNVQAVVLILKDSKSEVHSRLRLEGQAKSEFMTGLSKVTLTSKETPAGFVELSPDVYKIESYLITKVVQVKGLANQSEITGTDLDVAMGDPFVIDDTFEYTVLPGYTNGGTVLQLNGLIRRFFSEGSFGYKSEHSVVHYVKILKVLYKLSCLRYNLLQADGEAENYMVLTGHMATIRWQEETGNSDSLYFTLRDAKVLTDWLNTKYFKV